MRAMMGWFKNQFDRAAYPSAVEYGDTRFAYVCKAEWNRSQQRRVGCPP